MTVVRAAITQTTWTGDKESMIAKHEQFARDAARDGAQVICFQELFYGPYFGITEDKKYYRYAEPSTGPIVTKFAALAKELGVVMILPIYEEDITGVYYNTAVIVESDGTVLGQYRKHHIPNLDRFWEKFYFRPGNGGYPVFDTSVGKIGLYICYDRHFPEGWRELGLNGAHMVF
ncbi:MAG TPA: nitrilase-related carbon-nitrogen hydrolase, partial [Galbitalea sp.]